jgi:hypothetical protein
MRVALCLSGLPRALQEGYSSLYKHIIEKYNPDIFIHIWTEQLYYNPSEIVKPYEEYIKSVEFIMRMYKPKSIMIDKHHILKPEYQKYTEVNRYKGSIRHVYNMFSMYESLYLSNKLKIQYESNNNFIYNCVIRSRFDLNIIKDIELENYDMNKLNIEANSNPDKELTDYFAFGTSKIMDIYSDIYNHTSEICNTATDIYPEKIFKLYILNNKIKECLLYNITGQDLKFKDKII